MQVRITIILLFLSTLAFGQKRYEKLNKAFSARDKAEFKRICEDMDDETFKDILQLVDLMNLDDLKETTLEFEGEK